MTVKTILIVAAFLYVAWVVVLMVGVWLVRRPKHLTDAVE